ncbi:MAG: presqualene diphosphate synthase HpnD [Candidatus Omnitrophica bacterium]|nr:presqualene diphosphate synthase HpnD [Candidatus Omnitrophota bacterium]
MRPPPAEAASDYCRWLTRNAQSNFVPAIRLLPRPRRQAMEVIYAFCRAVDDVVDRDGQACLPERQGPGPEFVERAGLQIELWRRELDACGEGFPTHPIAVALKPVLERYQIPMEPFQALLAGVEMDLTARRYATFEELRVYCERVASAVGLISIRVFGCRHPAAARYAVSLGIALQLTNILRDLKSDAAAGRIYLPASEMDRFGYSERELLEGRVSGAFKRLMEFQVGRARGFFQEAGRALVESGEAKRLLPARIMGAVYARLLDRIEGAGYDVFSHRVKLSRGEQIRIALRCLIAP